MTAPRHRWFRGTFSLRTIFVVVTVLGLLLGWPLYILRQRIFARAWIRSHESATCLEFDTLGWDDVSTRDLVRTWVCKALGDRPVALIGFASRIVTLEEIQWLERVFPEGQISIPSTIEPQPISNLRPDGVVVYPAPAADTLPATEPDRP